MYEAMQNLTLVGNYTLLYTGKSTSPTSPGASPWIWGCMHMGFEHRGHPQIATWIGKGEENPLEFGAPNFGPNFW